MSPNLLGNTHGLFLAETQSSEEVQIKSSKHSQEPRKKQPHLQDRGAYSNSSSQKYEYKMQIVWTNVITFAILHSVALYGLGLLFFGWVKFQTAVFSALYIFFTGFGTTGGAHRLWAHRTYKANLPLRIFLMFGQTAALQNHIYEWARDHRVHHKYTDSNADPHNASRGFFFSHIGWLMCKKHKDVIEKGKTIDMSDIYEDPVVRFQMKYYVPLILIWTFALPTFIPCYFWNEDGWISFIMCITRYVLSLNGTWLINSAAHMWGMKPYDRTIKPVDSRLISSFAFGEGWHNFHHVFPWDYKAAELGNYSANFTTAFLDFFAKIGWATELKTTSEEMIRKRAFRTGDGSWKETDISKQDTDHHGHHHTDEHVWGWGDKDMKQDEALEIKLFNRIKA